MATSNTVRYLGFYLHSRLTWNPYTKLQKLNPTKPTAYPQLINSYYVERQGMTVYITEKYLFKSLFAEIKGLGIQGTTPQVREL